MSELTRSADLQPAGFYNLSPELAAANLGKFRLIDVRQPDEYTGPLSHIAGTTLIPLGTLAEAVSAVEWRKDEPILVICRSGGRSANGAATLVKLGFTEVYNLIGGMLVWNENRLPVEA